jgi:hypothetical protein
MGNLNRSWLALIFVGIVFLVGYIGFSIYQSYFSAEEEFNPTIVEFERSILISPKLEEHLDAFVGEIVTEEESL